MDTHTPYCFSQFKGGNNTGTHTLYPDPNKKYIVCTDACDDACRAQLSQEHDGTEFPVVFLSHTFTDSKKMEHNQTGGLWSLLYNN